MNEMRTEWIGNYYEWSPEIKACWAEQKRAEGQRLLAEQLRREAIRATPPRNEDR